MGTLRDGEPGRNDKRATSRPSTLGNNPGRLGALWAGVSPVAPGLDPGAAAGLTVPTLSAHLSIFSVGVRPVVFGLAFAEMARLAIPLLASWAAGAHDRSERLWRAARIIALALAAFQAMEMAKGMERLGDIAPSPGPMFRLGVVAAIVGATAFLIWLAQLAPSAGIVRIIGKTFAAN